eukprot:m.338513 g.338513  ORF g.338513 m.338513 type:complete len:294 (+) comp18450_c0_seq1:19-900(+)
MEVLDSHVHLAKDWKEGQGGLPNSWLPSMPESFQKDFPEEEFVKAISVCEGYKVSSYIFVECSNEPPLAEAKWTLDMVANKDSLCAAVVAHIPAAKGKAAVNDFLDGLRGEDKKLPTGLKGGRVVFLGDPMPEADDCLKPDYLAGLEALHAEGLHWEWCCKPYAIPSISKVCAKMPEMTFVLDHLGHNMGGEDFDTWAPAIDDLAKNKNVFAKIGAIEEWKVDSPDRYLDHALKAFGPERCMFESNWFVTDGMGFAYDRTLKEIVAACNRAGYTKEQIQNVLAGNAKRCYRLE